MKEKKSDKEIMAEYEAKVKALNLRWVDDNPIEKIKDDTEKSLLDIITEKERDRVRDHIICMYQDSCEDFEICESGSNEASFYEGMRNAYAGILWLQYEISYKYTINKPKNVETYKLKNKEEGRRK